jgi:DNA-directed RNA polymerase specialized sigma24 family protein
MIALWRKADKFDPATTGAAAWIFTIARNLRIDAVRSGHAWAHYAAGSPSNTDAGVQRRLGDLDNGRMKIQPPRLTPS